MTKLEYNFKNDILFKILFVKYPELLKQLVSALLSIKPESINQFVIINPEIPAEIVGDKFCRLDINMMINDQIVDLEVQVINEGNYEERSLYYWVREFSSTLKAGAGYSDLPCVTIVSIIAFNKFENNKFNSEFRIMEVNNHIPLTDKFCMLFYELAKLPKHIDKNDNLNLWLSLFAAETEKDLKKIEEMGVPIMQQAIDAYRSITATEKFKELERQRHYAEHNRATALDNARIEGENTERKKWQVIVAEVVAEKDTELEKKDIELEKKDMELEKKDKLIAELLALRGIKPSV